MIDRLNQDITPIKEQMIEYVQGVNGKILTDLCAHIEMVYGAKSQIDYSRCSAERGWNLKYKRSGKSVCTIYPQKDYFIVLITFTAPLYELFEALSNNFTAYTQDMAKNASGMNDTRWFWIEVKTKEIASDVKKLLDLKFGK